jgi:hypothetical protein
MVLVVFGFPLQASDSCFATFTSWTSFLTGSTLMALARIYADAINSGAVPNISSAWDSIVQARAQEGMAKAEATYQQAMREKCGDVCFLSFP